VSTEEDGVDEARRTTQPPLITAPQSQKADPDGEAVDTIVDNGTMSSSRTKTDDDAAGAGSSTTAPLPADTIGNVKGRSAGSSGSPGQNGRGSERQGSRQTMTSGNSIRLSDRKTGTAEPDDSADSAASAENATPAVQSDREPVSTPSTAARPATASTSAPASTAPAVSADETGTSYPGSSASAEDTGTARPPSRAWVPAGGVGSASPSDTGYSPANGFASGAGSATAGAATAGAAVGGANPVPPAWQQRGPVRGIQTRKSTKRQAMLTLARVEPWSVMKFSFVASVVAFVILFVAVAVLYMVLAALGVFDSLQHTVSSITSSQSSTGTNISHWFSASLILGYTAMLGALNIVLITAISTVGSVIYNLIAKTIGGIEVTLRETD
jgi:hypothetical protein